MYGRGGAIGGLTTGGGLAATGVPIAMSVILAFFVVLVGLLLLRWGKVRRGE
jgi:hypothetical protein